jgi:hypothetical protein
MSLTAGSYAFSSFAKPLHMKNSLISVFLFAALPFGSYKKEPVPIDPQLVTGNVFIITTDGFRWQEVFNGADSVLVNDEEYTPDTSTLKALYWAATPAERRRKLMPFLWSVVACKGQLYGNRLYGNKMNVANAYAKSYPGYNEIFTGSTDPGISSNAKNDNPNINVLEYLDKQPGFENKIAVFTSWDVFPYIFNKKRNGLFINSGYEKVSGPNLSKEQVLLDDVQEEGIEDKTATRYDRLTFINAKEYIKQNKPRVVYLGLGETDEFAHQGRYDLYLEQANKVDNMIAELWHWAQTTPGYKDNTTFIITTDHGRGSRHSKWTSHGEYIRGSSQTWLAIIGPHTKPLGEMKEPLQLYQEQMAQTIAHIAGQNFNPDNAAPAISIR